jgi:hypothetical protein
VALAATLESGRASAWGRIGLAGAVVSVGIAAALQGVVGVALKALVDRWVAAAGEAHVLAFEAAFAVRQIEIGLAAYLSFSFGFTVSVFGVAIVLSTCYPAWFGAIGLLGGLGTVAAGAAQASTGFSAFPMTLSTLSSSVLLVWAILAGVLMWCRRFESALLHPHLVNSKAGNRQVRVPVSLGVSTPCHAQGHSIRLLLPQRCASLNNREQESQESRRFVPGASASTAAGVLNLACGTCAAPGVRQHLGVASCLWLCERRSFGRETPPSRCSRIVFCSDRASAFSAGVARVGSASGCG